MPKRTKKKFKFIMPPSSYGKPTVSDITYPLSDEKLKDLIDWAMVAFRQNGTKVECEFPVTEEEEQRSDRFKARPTKLGSQFWRPPGDPKRSDMCSSHNAAHFIRQLVTPRFQRLTGFAHHLSSHFCSIRGDKKLIPFSLQGFPKVTKRADEPLTVEFATEQEAHAFAQRALLAAVWKLKSH